MRRLMSLPSHLSFLRIHHTSSFSTLNTYRGDLKAYKDKPCLKWALLSVFAASQPGCKMETHFQSERSQSYFWITKENTANFRHGLHVIPASNYVRKGLKDKDYKLKNHIVSYHLWNRINLYQFSYVVTVNSMNLHIHANWLMNVLIQMWNCNLQ